MATATGASVPGTSAPAECQSAKGFQAGSVNALGYGRQIGSDQREGEDELGGRDEEDEPDPFPFGVKRSLSVAFPRAPERRHAGAASAAERVRNRQQCPDCWPGSQSSGGGNRTASGPKVSRASLAPSTSVRALARSTVASSSVLCRTSHRLALRNPHRRLSPHPATTMRTYDFTLMRRLRDG